jgi:hypothetical protein
MVLAEIPVPDVLALGDCGPEAEQLIREAEARVERFTRSHRPRIDNFVVCDFRLVDSALRWIGDQNLLCGESFCEWGSGFGVVSLLASLHGLSACGIEVEPSLVEQSESLAEDQGIEARFACGSFIPSGGGQFESMVQEVDHVDVDSVDCYDELGQEIADFDLFFAFPWPGEHRFWETIFDRFASDGALLLTFQGIEQLRLQRHTASR